MFLSGDDTDKWWQADWSEVELAVALTPEQAASAEADARRTQVEAAAAAQKAREVAAAEAEARRRQEEARRAA